MYHGNHDDGDYHGAGKFISKDGSTYSGEWRQGKRSGAAEYFDANSGVVTVGEWQDNVLVKYNSHRIIAPNRLGFDALPLEEGFQWMPKRSEEEIADSEDDHHQHGDGCDHYHNNGGEVHNPEQELKNDQLSQPGCSHHLESHKKSECSHQSHATHLGGCDHHLQNKNCGSHEHMSAHDHKHEDSSNDACKHLHHGHSMPDEGGSFIREKKSEDSASNHSNDQNKHPSK